MNDLAEKALQGLDAARRQVVSHPATSLAVTGFLVSGFVVVAGGEVAGELSVSEVTTQELSRLMAVERTARADEQPAEVPA